MWVKWFKILIKPQVNIRSSRSNLKLKQATQYPSRGSCRCWCLNGCLDTIFASKVFKPEVSVMKQLFLRSLKRQEADKCIRFNTKNYSGTEKRRQMTLPGERLHISRQEVPRSIRTAAGNADSATCCFHSGCYSGEGQHLSEIPGKVSAHVLCEL